MRDALSAMKLSQTKTGTPRARTLAWGSHFHVMEAHTFMDMEAHAWIDSAAECMQASRVHTFIPHLQLGNVGPGRLQLA